MLTQADSEVVLDFIPETIFLECQCLHHFIQQILDIHGSVSSRLLCPIPRAKNPPAAQVRPSGQVWQPEAMHIKVPVNTVVPEVEKGPRGSKFQLAIFVFFGKVVGKEGENQQKHSLGKTVRFLSNSTTLGRELGREETSGISS